MGDGVHMEVAATLHALGNVHRAMSAFADARSCFVEQLSLLASLRERVGDDSGRIARGANNAFNALRAVTMAMATATDPGSGAGGNDQACGCSTTCDVSRLGMGAATDAMLADLGICGSGIGADGSFGHLGGEAGSGGTGPGICAAASSGGVFGGVLAGAVDAETTTANALEMTPLAAATIAARAVVRHAVVRATKLRAHVDADLI